MLGYEGKGKKIPCKQNRNGETKIKKKVISLTMKESKY